MNVKPRNRSDRGGYLMMPLVTNVPNPADATWKKVTCLKCGCYCWDRPLPEGFTEDMFDEKLCTMCALELNMGQKMEKMNNEWNRKGNQDGK